GDLLMDFSGAGGAPMTAALTVLGSVTVNSGGSLHLSTSSGGDLHLQGDFTNGNGITSFVHNNRSVFFEGGNNETITDGSGTLTMPYVRINKTGNTVALGSNLTTLGTNGGDSIQFTGATSTLTLSGKTLTLGSTVGTPPAGSGLSGDTAATLSLQDGGTTGAMGTLAFVTGGQNLGTLTINRTGTSASATFGSDVTVNGTLNLTSGDINMSGTNTLTMPKTAATTGNTDVVGNVRRTGFVNGLAATDAESFGNPNNQISFQTGTPPPDVTVSLAKSRPTGNGFGFPNAVNRTYTITPNGGTGYTATLRLHYLDSDLSGTPAVGEEAALDFWRFSGTTWQRVSKVTADPATGNWIESPAVTQFSPWTMAATPLAPTVARLRDFHATAYQGGTVIEWQTQYEVDNLGFNIYREDAGGKRVPVNSSLVAGSALAVGTHTLLGAGNAYTWVDRAGTASSRYWLEDINTDGKATLNGPFTSASAGKGWRAPSSQPAILLSQLGTDAATRDAQHQWSAPSVSVSAAPAARSFKARASSPTADVQRSLASGAAVKLSVTRSGWYRVTHAQLEAAGLSTDVDPARLQLYVEGVEQPIRVNNANAWEKSGSLEFYGDGLDTTATGTHVYWLIEGQSAGRRLGSQANAPVAQPPAEGDDTTTTGESVGITPVDEDPDAGQKSFAYTVERRDRTIYYSSLANGETENFFGRVVSSTPGTQALTVRSLEQLDSNQARLEVALQGVTATTHTVNVSINGTNIGTLEFAGREHKTAKFLVESWMMHEGDNLIELTSSKSGDVSLTDYLRLTYQRLYRADADALRFIANGGATVRVAGFTSANVRIVDITDPQNTSELPVSVATSNEKGDGWTATVQADSSTTPRTLYAFADNRVAEVAGVSANQPSDWHASRETDFVIVTHGSFTQAVAPLAAKREAEGLKTTVLDVEDLYDEFSYGEHSPQAVKDFLQWTTTNWQRAPRYVLLVGDGSYDPRNHTGAGSFDLVPTKLIDTQQMETASDNWYADFNNDGLAEMSVGRLPVRTIEEATLVLNKIAQHTPDAAPSSAVLVADRNGSDGYSFESATDSVQSLLPGTISVSRINRGAQSGDAVRNQIVGAINNGPSIVNWMGHGSINVWTGDGLLRSQDASALTNGGRLPLFVMMTCLNGYYQDPSLDSLSESLLKAGQGGALAVWTSTGMTEPEGQAAMNRELYRALFADGGALRLGDAMQRARTATSDTDVLRTWVLIGDPTTRWR
ncbi:MAG: C25 family cysteine peptidase, partial [Acidobacteria bacterium]|nr:C25 family cysteine peptidase [Acidobacteriota bacterium]